MNTLTHSSMSTAKTCLRKYHYSYVLCIEKDRTSAPLRFGANFHDGLDWLAQGETIETACQRIRTRYAELPSWAMDSPESEAEWFVECEKVLRLLCAYQWCWQNDEAEIIATEQSFTIPITNPDTGRTSRTFQLAGKIDKIVRLADGRLAVREHKTTGDNISQDSDYWPRLRLDQQISTYVLAAREIGHNVATVEYDVIHKPTISPKNPMHGLLKADKEAAQNDGIYYGETFCLDEIELAIEYKKESPSMYGARLSADIYARPENYFARREIPRLDADIAEFRSELWQIQKLVHGCELGGYWFRNTNACIHPYRCEFCDICFNNLNPSDRLPDGYRIKSSQHTELNLENNENGSTSSTSETCAATEAQRGDK